MLFFRTLSKTVLKAIRFSLDNMSCNLLLCASLRKQNISIALLFTSITDSDVSSITTPCDVFSIILLYLLLKTLVADWSAYVSCAIYSMKTDATKNRAVRILNWNDRNSTPVFPFIVSQVYSAAANIGVIMIAPLLLAAAESNMVRNNTT